VIEGDALDVKSLESAMKGQDVVISVLAGMSTMLQVSKNVAETVSASICRSFL